MTSVTLPNSEDHVLVPASPSLSFSSNLTDGGYDYELLGGTDTRYECPICLLYLRDPVLTTCGHRFCSNCISQWVLKEGRKCPVDGVNLSHENIFPDNYTRREIMQCKAKCPYSKDGCGIVMCLSDMERHIETEHLAVTTSPNSSKLSNGSRTSSIGMVDCLYKDVGCVGEFSRDQFQRHLDMDVHHHLQLLTAAYKRLKVFSSRPSLASPPPEHFIRQDSRDSTRWLLAEDTVDSDNYEFRRQRSWDSVRFARKNYCKPRYPERLAESDESLCQKSSEIPEEGGVKPGILKNSTSGDFKDVYERLVRLEQNDREKQIKIDQLEKRWSSAMHVFSKVTQMMDDLTARYCHGVFVWRIPVIRRHCVELRKDCNKHLYSPGFYTDTFGHKLCLTFSLNTHSAGVGAGIPVDLPLEHDEDSFVSLKILCQKGEFDDALSWPYEGEITMSIIHPSKPEDSLTEIMQSTPSAAFAKPIPHKTPVGFGYNKFCPLAKIFSSGFVKDDILVCKIIAKSQ